MYSPRPPSLKDLTVNLVSVVSFVVVVGVAIVTAK